VGEKEEEGGGGSRRKQEEDEGERGRRFGGGVRGLFSFLSSSRSLPKREKPAIPSCRDRYLSVCNPRYDLILHFVRRRPVLVTISAELCADDVFACRTRSHRTHCSVYPSSHSASATFRRKAWKGQFFVRRFPPSFFGSNANRMLACSFPAFGVWSGRHTINEGRYRHRHVGAL